MDNDNLPNRNKQYVLSIMIASLFVNVDILQFQPLVLWVRIMIPLLLVFGYFGNKFQNPPLRIVGWLGIALFFMVASAAALPGEEYVLGHYTNGPPEVGTFTIIIRLLAALTITSFLLVSYWKRSKKSETHP